MWTELWLILKTWRRVWNSVHSSDRLALMFAVLLMPVTGILSNLPAILLGRLVDKTLHSPPDQAFVSVLPFLLGITGALVVREVLSVARKYVVENACTLLHKAKTLQLISHLLRLDFGCFRAEERVGGIKGRMYRSIEGFIRLIKLGFLDLLPAAVTASCALVVVFLRNPALAGVMALVVPFGAAIVLLQIKTQKGIRIALLRVKEEIDGRVVELLGGIEYIRSANTEDLESGKVDASCEHLRSKEIQHHLWMAIYDAAKYLNEAMFLIAVLCLTICLVYQGRASAGDILAYSVLFAAVVNPLKEVHRILDEAHESCLCVNDLFELLDKPEDPSYVTPPAPPPGNSESKPQIEVQDVLYFYPGQGGAAPSLNHVSFQIHRGETVGIVGMSGSGKTTLMKALLRLIHPSSGSIRINGRELAQMSRSDIAQQIGYVSQTPFLFCGTVEENISYGCGAVTHAQVEEAARKAQIHHEIIHMPGQYQAMVSERGGNLSGGQRQRIAIARIILKNPSIMILDEATSALDNLNEKAVQAAMIEATKGRTLIIVAHRLTTIAGADHLLVMRDGHIVEKGAPDELLQQDGFFTALNTSSVDLV